MKASLTDALRQLPAPPTDAWPQGVWHAFVLRHGSMSAGVFAPRGPDVQRPHAQDELYFIAHGSADLLLNGEHLACQAGDVVFVPAHAAHHFEQCSADFVTWVVFWGPEGGEKTD